LQLTTEAAGGHPYFICTKVTTKNSFLN